MKAFTLWQGDCLELMKDIPDGSVDLTVTSPPYDDLRTYKGNIDQWCFEKFKQISKELFRVTSAGGVVVWIVSDATIRGSETGTSFRQALWFMECGFNLHDTMIWSKPSFTAVGALKTRYAQTFEYMCSSSFDSGGIVCCFLFIGATDGHRFGEYERYHAFRAGSGGVYAVGNCI